MMKVDLSLAINYLPACGCLARLLCFLLSVSGIQAAQEIGGYTVLAAFLYFDRVLTPNLIFDSNAILLAVYLSQVHGVVRGWCTAQAHPVPMGLCHVLWCACCLALICYPPQVRSLFERRPLHERLVSTGFLLLMVTVSAFYHADRESLAVLGWRAIGFTLLCFGWIYVVGIEDSHGIEQLKHVSHPFLHRMAPMLYSPLACTACFFPLAVGGLVYQYLRRYRPQYIPEYPAFEAPQGYARVATNPPAQPLECIVEDQSESEDLEELLRVARQRTAGPRE